MGMTSSVTFAGPPPEWSSVRGRLVELGHLPQMRMIDGMPAFPDEDPPEGWREIRVSFGAGMVTIRAEGPTWNFIVWGNADETTLAHRDLLARACSE